MSKRHSDKAVELNKRFRLASKRVQPPVLAVGVDVTWWGGSGKTGERQSRKECIAFARRDRDGWSIPEFKRITLTCFNPNASECEPNADPDGNDLATELVGIIEKQGPKTRVVVALDAPLIAMKSALPKRKKSPKVGEVERRACDREWAVSVSLSPKGWRSINILPGAPLPPRIAKVIKKIRKAGFEMYIEPSATCHDRLLIECFPNEVIWSAGVLGHSDNFTFGSMAAYKQMGKSKAVLPLATLRQICEHTFRPCLQLTTIDVDEWISAFWNWLVTDDHFVFGHEGKTGKGFDDAIDSMLALISAMSFVDGSAHIHQGKNPMDGHIIGPGMPHKINCEIQ
jgi:hypothetical protein